jgi:dehydrogenase/reductase SDR family protein 1
MSPTLAGRTAIVTGASRGVGRGVAQVLADNGATTYATGRTIQSETFRRGAGEVIVSRCDHTVDSEVETFFRNVRQERGHIDILVNNVWGGYAHMFEDGEFTWPEPFWRQPISRWDSMFAAGVRAHYVASAHAAESMVERGSGLIANISSWAAQKHIGNVAYGAAKAATDKLTRDMAHELKDHGIAVVSLYPGLVRTEKVMESAAFLDLSNSESPEFTGRAITALATDVDVLPRTGRILVVAALANEYGFTDVDGSRPRPLTLGDV